MVSFYPALLEGEMLYPGIDSAGCLSLNCDVTLATC